MPFFKDDFLKEKTKEILTSDAHFLNEVYEKIRVKSRDGDLPFLYPECYMNPQEIMDFSKQKRIIETEVFVVLGIGGSALGAKAIYKALRPEYIKPEKELIVLDNVDPDQISDLSYYLKDKKVHFFVISKSGTTLETLSQFQYFREFVKKEYMWDYQSYFTFIIGEDAPIKEHIIKENFHFFSFPKNLSGRFSVFSVVWFVPLACLGIDIFSLFDGIVEARTSAFEKEIEKNLALKLAVYQYEFYKKQDKDISVFWVYSHRLFILGEWYKQLVWESLGKNNAGINLFHTLGVVDQHSQLQLFMEGKDDKSYFFLECEEFGEEVLIWNHSFADLMNIERESIKEALREGDKESMSLVVEKNDEKEIASLMLTLEMQVAFLWEMLLLNTFDQPWVERGKVLMKQKLKDQFWIENLIDTIFKK